MEPALWKLNGLQVLGFASFGLALGVWLKTKIRLLDHLNIPASVVGGLVYAVIALVLRDRYLNLEMDLVLRDIMMVGFFTCIGMSASLRLLRVGGVQVLLFFAIASIGAVLQNLVGMAGARFFSLDPLLGLISGSVALTGGPATALAFGDTFEKMGVSGAATLGVASATFGITAGGILGGYIGSRLIEKHRLHPPAKAKPDGARHESDSLVYAESDKPSSPPTPLDDESASERSPLTRVIILVAISMGLGTLISNFFVSLGLVLPSYIGAMLAAAAIRNLDDWLGFAKISQHTVDVVGNISLNLFIVMALMTLRLWELVHLALPLVVILVAQVILVWLMCITMAYYPMGRDYEAAVMSGGFCGFMLGTTANAMACMDVLAQKYGQAPRAFIVVPLVGAFLIDFTNAIIITTMANLLR